MGKYKRCKREWKKELRHLSTIQSNIQISPPEWYRLRACGLLKAEADSRMVYACLKVMEGTRRVREAFIPTKEKKQDPASASGWVRLKKINMQEGSGNGRKSNKQEQTISFQNVILP